MKYTSLFFLLLATCFCGDAQQLQTSSFYELYSVLHNPGTAGSKRKPVIGGSFRTQWRNMPDGPRTGLVYGQAYLAKAKIGLGGYLYNDVTGPTSRTGLQMAYAYYIPVNEEQRISFGFEARLQELRFDRVKLQTQLGSLDPVFLNLSNRLKADAGFGLSYTTPVLQVGASVSQLVQTKYDLYERTGTPAEQSKFYRHYYLHGNYTFKTDEEMKIIPTALFIYLPNAPLEMQTGVRIDYNNILWYGLSWRARQGWMLSAGVNVNERFTIGYSFDLYTSPLSIFESGSTGHEVLLQYSFR